MQDMSLNYRNIIRGKFVEKRSKNASFSLRAFAKRLGVDSGYLSYVLNGKRNLSDAMTVQFAERLELSAEESKRFELLVRLEKTESAEQKRRLLDQLNDEMPEEEKVRNLTVDHFVMISEWYHFAILELLNDKKFDWTTENVAKSLNVSGAEVELALERMRSLEIIDYQYGSRPQKITDRVKVQSQAPNDALRKYHTTMLQKAAEALLTQKTDERITTTRNLTLSRKQLKAADELADEFFRKLKKLSETKGDDTNEVYHFSVNGFAITENQKLKKEKKA
jgi:uncharacterized protein (TIGR02147 family)